MITNIQKAILFFVVVSFSTISAAEDPAEYSYSTMAGIQVFFLRTTNAYMYATMTPSVTGITIDARLYLKEGLSEVTPKMIFASIGWNSNSMKDSDMITLHYDGKGGFMANDCWSIKYDVKTDVMWDATATNDVLTNTGSAATALATTDPLYASYKTVLQWNVTKKFNTADKYDWSGYDAWFKAQTTQIPIIASWGYPLANGMLKRHVDRSPQTLFFVDGSGLAEVKAGTEATTQAPTTTPVVTSSVLLQISFGIICLLSVLLF